VAGVPVTLHHTLLLTHHPQPPVCVLLNPSVLDPHSVFPPPPCPSCETPVEHHTPHWVLCTCYVVGPFFFFKLGWFGGGDCGVFFFFVWFLCFFFESPIPQRFHPPSFTYVSYSTDWFFPFPSTPHHPPPPFPLSFSSPSPTRHFFFPPLCVFFPTVSPPSPSNFRYFPL